MAAPTIVTTSPLPDGTVGVPYSTNIVLSSNGSPQPLVLGLGSGSLPAGLDNTVHAKKVSQDGSGFGSPLEGETITGETSGTIGVVLKNDAFMNFRPISGPGFINGENVDGNINGFLGVINSATTDSGIYIPNKIFLPTQVVGSVYNDLLWVISGTPTVAGVYSIGFVVWDENEVKYSYPLFSLTINAAPVPAAPASNRRGGVGGYVRYPDEIIFRSDVQYSQVQYYRRLYNLYIVDDAGFLHYINTSSNISNRGGRNWWAVSLYPGY